VLEVRNLVVHYDKVQVLKGISLKAEDGSVTALIGANGAGKSTCLKAISGLLRPTSGEIWFMGKRVDGCKPEDIVKMGITHIPEGKRLFPWMNVVDNLLVGALLRKDREAVKNDIERVYGYFPVLRAMRSRYARDMSGGEQQMLAFGRGLLTRPRFLLMDEPSMGLAPKIVQEVMDTIKRIAENENVGVILVEQNANMALRLAARAYVLELGSVVMEGDAQDLMANEGIKKAYLGM
jgi:branched-chain amino acid transport system ATP-binding protein